MYKKYGFLYWLTFIFDFWHRVPGFRPSSGKIHQEFLEVGKTSWDISGDTYTINIGTFVYDLIMTLLYAAFKVFSFYSFAFLLKNEGLYIIDIDDFANGMVAMFGVEFSGFLILLGCFAFLVFAFIFLCQIVYLVHDIKTNAKGVLFRDFKVKR